MSCRTSRPGLYAVVGVKKDDGAVQTVTRDTVEVDRGLVGDVDPMLMPDVVELFVIDSLTDALKPRELLHAWTRCKTAFAAVTDGTS